MRVYSNQYRPFTEVRYIAVAIAVVREGQQHTGILHKVEDLGEVKLGHLEWHNRLKESEPKDSYLWVDPPIPTRRARQVAALCRKVLRSNQSGIPYAFSPPNDCFDPEAGSFLLGPSRFGLTCATFVLAVFDAAGIRLIEFSSWPQQRPGDADWQRFVIEQLEHGEASAEHVAFVKNELGYVRYRPEDVAGCAASDQLPCSFKTAEPLSQEILNQLRALRKPLRV